MTISHSVLSGWHLGGSTAHPGTQAKSQGPDYENHRKPHDMSS